MKKQWTLATLVVVTGLQTSLPAHADRAAIGALLGGAGGAALGSTIGGGNGRIAAMIAGGIIGSVVGSKVGHNMDEADRRAYLDAQRYCLSQGSGTTREWYGNSRTGAHGSFTTGREGRNYQTGETCREYTSTIYVGNQVENSSGIACIRSDGSYYETSSSMVRYGSEPVYNDDRLATPGYNNYYGHKSHTHHDANNDQRGHEYRRERPTDSANSDGYYTETHNQTVDYERTYQQSNGIPMQNYPGNQNGYPQNQNGYPGYGPIYDRGSAIVVPSPYAPSPYPYPGQVPAVQATVQFQNILRDEGGAWYRITFNHPVTLTTVNLQVQGAGVKVYDTAVVTESGSRLPIVTLSNTPVLTSNTPMQSPINGERVFAIDFRAEGFYGPSSLVVSVMMADPQGAAVIIPSIF